MLHRVHFDYFIRDLKPDKDFSRCNGDTGRNRRVRKTGERLAAAIKVWVPIIAILYYVVDLIPGIVRNIVILFGCESGVVVYGKDVCLPVDVPHGETPRIANAACKLVGPSGDAACWQHIHAAGPASQRSHS